MKNIAFWSLLGLNGVLVASPSAVRTCSPSTTRPSPNRSPPRRTSRDDYLMVPGEINGGNNAIVYVLDETTKQLSSMSYDDSMHKLATMPAARPEPRLRRDWARTATAVAPAAADCPRPGHPPFPIVPTEIAP